MIAATTTGTFHPTIKALGGVIMSGNVSISLSPANRNGGNTEARRLRIAFEQAFCPPPPNLKQILADFDDLAAHGDDDAAALALADAWQCLPPIAKSMAANLIFELAKKGVER
jgi:hypothetical protein